MIAAALEAEVADHIDRFVGDLDQDGHRPESLHPD
jgi:hypothetical protein